MEQYCNDPGTILTSPAASTDTTIQVSSSTGYPSTGNFRIRVDDELMLVTAVSGATWTVLGWQATADGTNIQQTIDHDALNTSECSNLSCLKPLLFGTPLIGLPLTTCVIRQEIKLI
jgi:hypothetical protein